MQTIDDVISDRGNTSGFDYLRIILSVSIIAWHTTFVCYGRDAETFYITGPIRPLIMFIVPCFFALSGFLVAGSLERNSLPAFITLRGLRIFPALAVEIVLSALIVGPFVTSLTLQDYFTSSTFYKYFLNLVGDIHYHLPGVFETLPARNYVNVQLWTIPFELECYITIGAISLIGLVSRPKLVFLLTSLAVVVHFVWHFSKGGFPSLNEFPPGRMLVVEFLFGALIFLLRRSVPYSRSIFVVALMATWALLMRADTLYLSTLPLAYVTMFLGLQNPPRTVLIHGADYSYGIYLYGFPIQQLVAFLFPDFRYRAANFIISVSLAWICAWLSWNLVESNVLAKKKWAVALANSATRLIVNRIRGFATVNLVNPSSERIADADFRHQLSTVSIAKSGKEIEPQLAEDQDASDPEEVLSGPTSK